MIAASELMQQEKKNEAKTIIEELLKKYPMDEETYVDAVNIYLEGGMYVEAKNIFKMYFEKTGNNLKNTDFTLADIEQEEKENEAKLREIESQSTIVFTRSSILERGTLVSSHFTLFPVRRIEIDNDKIVLIKGFKTYCYKWSEILNVTVKRKRLVGARWGGLIKLMIIKSKDKSFKFDVSETCSDFKNSNALIEALREHLKINVTGIKKTQGFISAVIVISIMLTVIYLLFHFEAFIRR